MISDADPESWNPKGLDSESAAVAEASIPQADAHAGPAEPSRPH